MGGSYQLLNLVARDAQPFADRAPHLRALQGFPYATLARYLIDAGKYDEAYAAYTKALTFGEEGDWYGARANVALHLDRFDDAMADVVRQKASYGPNVQDDLVGTMADKLWSRVSNKEDDGDFAAVLRLCGALTKYLTTNTMYLGCQARAHSRLERYKEAGQDYRALIKLDPDEWAYYEGLLLALEHTKGVKTFFGVIDPCIKRHPDDGAGYAFRGEAFAFLSRRDEAQRDYQKACDLGYPGGCRGLDFLPPPRHSHRK